MNHKNTIWVRLWPNLNKTVYYIQINECLKFSRMKLSIYDIVQVLKIIILNLNNGFRPFPDKQINIQHLLIWEKNKNLNFSSIINFICVHIYFIF